MIHRASSVVCLIALTGCVSLDRYNQAVKDADGAHAEATRLSTELASARADLARLQDELKKAQARSADRDQTIALLQAGGRDFQNKLDAATAENASLRAELARLGKNADALLSQKGALAHDLADAKARLEELRRAQAAAEARTRLFKELAMKFQRMVDAGQLKVVLRNGRMVLQLSNDVLFDSGRTDIKPAGQEALQQIARVLKTIPDRRFQVAGDTDNVPIHNARFASNWELSTRRAVEVVHYLVSQGLRPEVVSAAGYGEFDPIAANDTDDGRRKNRRIEITLEPNINELVSVPTTPQ